MKDYGLTRLRLTSLEQLAEDVFLLSFPRKFDFLPGQVIGISDAADGPRRLYSICSGKDENQISILFNVVEEGYMTPRLSELSPGDPIWITGPRGEFTYDPSPAYWIATGTGIAPFFSMFRSAMFEEKILIHGEKYLERFWFYNELSAAFGQQYIPCCSREENEGMFSGRVSDYLRNIIYLPAEHKYYLCGRAEMVVEVRDILIDRGIPFTNILSEIYF